MTRPNKLQVYITDLEKEKLRAEAARRQVPMSEVIQDFIKSLPDPVKNTTED